MKTFLALLKGFSVVAIGVFIAAAGPEIHSAYLRNYVGSKTVMIKKGRGGGSGFFVKAPSGETYILTNRHVCEMSTDGILNVILPGKGRVVQKKIIEKYDAHDLCLIEGESDYTGLDLASMLYVGQTIAIIGHPKLHPLTLSKGEYIGDTVIKIVTGYNIPKKDCRGKVEQANLFLSLFGMKSVCVEEYYSGHITAYSRGGSSGSPIVNFFGNTVGVLFAGNRMDPFETYIVLLDDVKNFLKDY